MKDYREYNLGSTMIKRAKELDKDSSEFKQMCTNVIETNDAELNYLFARDVEGAPAKKHGEVVLRSNDPYLNYLFATEVMGADIPAHKRIVAKFGSRELLNKLVHETTPIDELEF